jgi:glycosyltransferase involved in cell wall biosynthesis
MPEISVIIPTLNRSQHLTRCLNTIAIQSLRQDIFEVIIVDNGSNDTTADVVKFFISRNPKLSIRYIYDPEPGLLTGRHRGASEAYGDFLVFIDDDVELSPRWLESIYNYFVSNKDTSFITGPCLPLFESYPPEWLKYFWSNKGSTRSLGYLSLIDMGNIVKSISPTSVWGLNFAIRKDVFYKLKGFHPDCISDDLQKFQGDGELGLTGKAVVLNYKATYLPGAFLYHLVPEKRMTSEYFEKRAYYQGVSDSFSQLKNITTSTKKTKIPKITMHKIMRRVSNLCAFFNDRKNYNDYRSISNKCVLKYNSGYSFHRGSLNDKNVAKWVSQENYLDYKLPFEGGINS